MSTALQDSLPLELAGQVWCSDHAAGTARDMEARADAMLRRAARMAANGRRLLDDGYAAGQDILDGAHRAAAHGRALSAEAAVMREYAAALRDAGTDPRG
jgi:hypothetical protein